jgi:heat shock protein HtpX
MNGINAALVVYGVMKNLEKLEQAAHFVPPATAQPSTASLFIVNPFSGSRGLVFLFSTHPPMQERVRRLRDMNHSRYAA